MEEFTNSIGWIGAACFALCAVPQALTTLRERHAHGISILFLLLWLAGEVCLLFYSFMRKDWPLLFNYCGNLLCLIIILYYKVNPAYDLVEVQEYVIEESEEEDEI